MDRKVYIGPDTLDFILQGMQIVGDAVGSTYGPNGRNVIIEDDDGKPHVTKDGVTVAKSLSFSNVFHNLGAHLVKDASIKTLREVGDGTTTTAILAAKMAQKGFKAVKEKKLNPFLFRKELEKLTDFCIDHLKKHSTPVDKSDTEVLMQVAMNSSNGDKELSEKIVSLFSKIGKDGVVTVRDSGILGVHTQIVDGMSIDRGYASQMFCNEGQSTVELVNPYILIAKRPIQEYRDLAPYLQTAINNERPILLIVPEIDNGVVEMILTNIYHGSLSGGCVIQAPYSNERQQDFFRDLGVASGAIKDEKDWNEPYLLGEAEQVTVGRLNTEFKGLRYDEEAYKRHLAFLEDMVQTQSDRFLAEKAGERLAMFSGSIGYIHVGAPSETELLELKDRVDDVTHAVQSALKEGVVPGGGMALHHISLYLQAVAADMSTPEKREAMDSMVYLLGVPAEMLSKAETDTKDPTKVVYTALKNAISVAGMLFTSNCVVVDER